MAEMEVAPIITERVDDDVIEETFAEFLSVQSACIDDEALGLRVKEQLCEAREMTEKLRSKWNEVRRYAMYVDFRKTGNTTEVGWALQSMAEDGQKLLSILEAAAAAMVVQIKESDCDDKLGQLTIFVKYNFRSLPMTSGSWAQVDRDSSSFDGEYGRLLKNSQVMRLLGGGSTSVTSDWGLLQQKKMTSMSHSGLLLGRAEAHRCLLDTIRQLSSRHSMIERERVSPLLERRGEFVAELLRSTKKASNHGELLRMLEDYFEKDSREIVDVAETYKELALVVESWNFLIIKVEEMQFGQQRALHEVLFWGVCGAVIAAAVALAYPPDIKTAMFILGSKVFAFLICRQMYRDFYCNSDFLTALKTQLCKIHHFAQCESELVKAVDTGELREKFRGFRKVLLQQQESGKEIKQANLKFYFGEAEANVREYEGRINDSMKRFKALT